ncbi:glycosyltransferase [Niveispirillum fermenti]|uniref:glycosyltransferase n=1 Tax=Niveispirillum fermenti TaxID=1233113 RepID=UPI003A8791A0
MPINPAECRRRLADDPADLIALQSLAMHMRDTGDGMQALRLYRRAHVLHRDTPAFDRQVDATLHVALNQISALLDPGHFEEAETRLEWLASFIPPSGDLARLLATVWFIRGREGDAIAMLPRAGITAPEDSGIAVAMRALDTHRQQYGVIGTVIIPAFKAADTIGESLDSILTALAHYRTASGREDAQVHIVVVDDASPDDTVDVVRRWGRAHPDQGLALIVNNQNRGAGRARNAGVAAALGPYLWFLDADDRFLERHFHLTASVLDANPRWDYVRTDILFDHIDAQISTAWRDASVRTYPCNLCIRREAHTRSGGFPEETPFWPATADDVAYSRAITLMLKGIQIGVKTVFYRMRPGNVLDRLQAEMTSPRPPGVGGEVDARFMAIEILIRRRLHALTAGHEATERDRAKTATVLVSLAHERTGADDHATAHALLRRATGLAPTLATAWFELGLAAHRLSRRNEAKAAFARAVGLCPDLAPPHVNLGLLLAEDGDAATALPHLHRAVELAPNNANARFLLARVLRRLGRTADATVNLQQAIALSPTLAEYHAEWSGLLLDGGDDAAALAAADRAISLSPGLYGGHAARAAALEALERPGDALAAWDRAIACNQGYGEAFTRRALLLLTGQWGPAPTPRARARNDGQRLALTRLGSNGRFGNQILQYGTARLYAQRHGLTLETPPWIGRHLFGLDDPLPGPALPRLSEEAAGLATGLAPGAPPFAAGHDIDGYFCGDTTAFAPFADDFRGFFTRAERWRGRMAQVADRLRQAGDTVVALHLRRGDFGWGPFWIAPEAWYLDWLADIWPRLERPALYIATDDPASLAAFAGYRPLTAAGLGLAPISGAGFLDDFQALCAADILAISNSTFSFTAGLLNDRAMAFHRPDRAAGLLISFDPWASPALLH